MIMAKHIKDFGIKEVVVAYSHHKILLNFILYHDTHKYINIDERHQYNVYIFFYIKNTFLSGLSSASFFSFKDDIIIVSKSFVVSATNVSALVFICFIESDVK